MDLNDYTPPPIFDNTPRPRASQDVAARKRARDTEPDAPAAAPPALKLQHLIVAALGVVAVVGVLALAVSQLGSARPLVVPTETATPTAQAFGTNHQASPEARTAPTATSAPVPSPVPTEAVLAVPVEPAQSGRGLTLVDQSVDAEPPTPEPPAPSYIDNVGAQAPHSPRGDGQPGPNGGDWARVPTAEPAMLEIIGAQAPHKVR